MEDKKQIENRQKNELNGMAHFLDSIIIKSLDLEVSTKYKGFVESMEEHEDLLFHEIAKILGTAIIMTVSAKPTLFTQACLFKMIYYLS